MTTKEVEQKIYWKLKKLGTYLCFEVGMPREIRGMNIEERVDLLTYDTNKIWRFYELKVSKKDFHSKAKVTFLGHYNYYVMPKELYDAVKDEIPDGIGCYVCTKSSCYCIKKPEKRKLGIPEEKLKMAFIQSLSRKQEKLMSISKEDFKKIF